MAALHGAKISRGLTPKRAEPLAYLGRFDPLIQAVRMTSSLASGPKNSTTRLIKEIWAFTGPRLTARFAYERHDHSGRGHHPTATENWEFNEDGLMVSSYASTNDFRILEANRKYHWAIWRHPNERPGLSHLGV